MTFDSLGLNPSLLAAVRRLGFRVPTPIQALAVPIALQGRDILGRAKTGSGKTAAFALPILHQLGGPGHRFRALVLAPTRELATQIHAHFEALAIESNLRGALVVGGDDDRSRQEHELRSGADWLIATPGRLIEHLDGEYVDLGALEFLVLDEADRLLELGFASAVRRIAGFLPEQRHTYLFSATLPAETEQLARAVLHEPRRIDAESTGAPMPPEELEQVVWPVAAHQKQALLALLASRGALGNSILVFARTKARAERIAGRLDRDGMAAAFLHGDREQAERRSVLEQFTSGAKRFLVATDVAARGLDLECIDCVVNFDVPDDPDTYLHRVGRTARAGRGGRAVMLQCEGELTSLAGIERRIGKRLPEERYDDFPYEPERGGRRPREPKQSRPHESLSDRTSGTDRRESPFTKTGKAKRGYEAPDPAAEVKRKRRRSRIRRRLPHQK